MNTTISELARQDGKTVTLQGWVYSKRSGGKVVFLQLRDGTGICQCIVEAKDGDIFESAKDLTQESSLRLTGVVRADERAPGGFEIAATALDVIQIADEYPISRKAHGIDFLMSNRHLWLRSRGPTIVLRIRHTIIKAIRDYFDADGFTLVDTPVLTPGAGEDAQTLFEVDYFGEPVYLTQTGQLYLECAAMALRKVYCFGPTFRAEKSKTRRHLTEFWMVEPEVAFAELDDIVDLAEGLICAIVEAVLARHEQDLLELGRDLAPLRRVQAPFDRITYTDAAETLRSAETRALLEEELERDRARLAEWEQTVADLERQHDEAKKAWQKDKLDVELQHLRQDVQELERDLESRPQHIELAQNFAWGKDLGGSDETIISKLHAKPVFVTDYPREAKAFYMKQSAESAGTVRNMDLLAPDGYGEIIGGSQREEQVDVLVRRIQEQGLDPADYDWYVDLRKYGTVPHGGFGLGVERTLSWICGLKHVRETIAFPRLMGRIYP
ncbi:MAG: OB-fold nucleic acid binding domain-containing protein [Verrucomicrobia bacterium]|nr:OB-fold nucleic acid binding domain-containing protein [Verrucomicrobiota bacterium]MDA1088052.1 OB-fold nucleic acid binding domain-containing protein [Verrucomicrobiota bacterium]